MVERPSKDTFIRFARVNATLREIEMHVMNGRLTTIEPLLDRLDKELGDFEASVRSDTGGA
jgi:hypothetical protein